MTSLPWYDKNDTEFNNERAKKAYTAMLTVTPKQPNDDAYTKVSNEVSFAAEWGLCIGFGTELPAYGVFYILLFGKLL